jgi:Leucine-rich repeat (LRR) protein
MTPKSIARVLGLSLLTAPLWAQVHIPDPNLLQALIDAGVDQDADHQISESEAQDVYELWIESRGIEDLTGLEAFVNLGRLLAFNNLVTQVDLRPLTQLWDADFSMNPLAEVCLNPGWEMQLMLMVDDWGVITTDCPGGPGWLHFPDPELRALLLWQADADMDGGITPQEAESVLHLDLSWGMFSDLSGLEHFVNLEYLNLSGFQNFNHGGLPSPWPFSALQELHLQSCALGSLDLGGLSQLRWLDATDNQLISIDLSPCPALEGLLLSWSTLESLDLSPVPGLSHADLQHNHLTEIDLREHPTGLVIQLQGNPLERVCVAGMDHPHIIDVDDPAVVQLCIEGLIAFGDENALQELIMQGVDLNGDGAITVEEAAAADSIEFTYLPIHSLEGLEHFVNLIAFRGYDLRMDEIDWTGYPRLERFHVSGEMHSLALRDCPALDEVSVQGNNSDETQYTLTQFELENCPTLRVLHLSMVAVEHLDLSNQTQLVEISSDGILANRHINLRDCLALERVHLNGLKAIESVDVRGCVNLRQLDIWNGYLTQIDLSDCLQLEGLDLSYHEFTDLDLSHLHQLKWLYLGSNQLQRVLLADDAPLVVVDATYNPDLTELDLADYPTLTHIRLQMCGFDEVSVRGCTGLRYLFLNDSPNLRSVDMSSFLGMDYVQIWLDGCPSLEQVCVDPSFVINPHPAHFRIDDPSVLVWGCDDVVEAAEQPVAFALHPAAPNPFNPTTQIRFSLSATGPVELAVYNLRGARVATLVDGVLAAGEHGLSFDGGRLASGPYLVRLSAEGQQAVQRILLIK